MDKLYKKISPYILVALLTGLSTIILWLPFLLRQSSWFGLKIENSNFLYIYKNYDGPLYIVPAKTLYQPDQINLMNIDIKFPAKYFAAHFPLYPLLIRITQEIGVVGGYLKSMVFVNLLATILVGLFFYYFLKHLRLSGNPFLLTVIFLMLPRFLIVRSIGSPESLFILAILLSLYFFEKEKFLLAGIFGGLATMTKSPGIILFLAYGLTAMEQYWKTKKFNWRWLLLGLIPLGLLGVFGLYLIQYKDFFAYFHSGDNIHLVAPFSVFNFQKTWVGTAWLEDIIFYFFLYLITAFSIRKIKYRSLFYFSLVFLIATIFVQHRDIARYSLPLWPFACIAFEKFFTSRRFLIIFAVLLIAIYFYGWNFLLFNIMPIGEWKPFL